MSKIAYSVTGYKYHHGWGRQKLCVDVHLDESIQLSAEGIRILTENANERLKDTQRPNRRHEYAMRRKAYFDQGMLPPEAST